MYTPKTSKLRIYQDHQSKVLLSLVLLHAKFRTIKIHLN